MLGGPTIDKISALVGVTTDTDDFEVLGAFYGAPAKMIKCETIDVMVPANAEIVLECELMALEGLVYDEGPYGEFTGMYGGGIKHNYRLKVKAMTYRKGGIFQHCTIGGLHPWYTDNMLQLPAIEADLFNGLKQGGIDVREVRCPLGGLSNIAYAKINPLGAGDSKQALGIMLTCSKQGLPKIAMVFNTDVDIWDDQAVLAAMAYRYMPDKDTVRLDGLNTMTVDPEEHDLGHRLEDRHGLHGAAGPGVEPQRVRAQHRHRSRRSAGQSQDHDGRGADQGHGGVHPGRAARLARHPEAVSRPALSGALSGVRQSAPQARSHQRSALVPLHTLRHAVLVGGQAAAREPFGSAPHQNRRLSIRMAASQPVRRMVVGITGASGTVYGIRVLEALRAMKIESHLVISKAGDQTRSLETDVSAAEIRALADKVYAPGDIAAAISSGSFHTMGMIVAPCSVRTLSEIATGVTSSLVARAADVCLKERRRVVLMFRETPLHAGHIKSMLAVTEMGAIVAVPVPAFYARPRTVDDIVTHSVARALDLFGLDTKTFPRWTGPSGLPSRRRTSK